MAKRGASLRAFDLGPTLRATPYYAHGQPGTIELLTERQRLRLAQLATRLRLRPRTIIYREGAPADYVFFSADGVVKAYRDLANGKRWVTAFLYPHDLFGMAEHGRYVRTAQTITAVQLYRIDKNDLIEALKSDAELQLHFVTKMIHELREAQRQTIVVGRRDAVGRVTMFLRQLEKQTMKNGTKSAPKQLDIPMTRSDIASYLRLSLEAFSRATAALRRAGIIEFDGAHAVKILDRSRFQHLALAV